MQITSSRCLTASLALAMLLPACSGGGGAGAQPETTPEAAPPEQQPTPQPSLPAIASLSTLTGFATVGTPLTIDGSNFAAPASVQFGDEDATDVVVVDENTITCTAPPGEAGSTVTVKLTTNGQSIDGPDFTYADPLEALVGDWLGAAHDASGQSQVLHGYQVSANGTATVVSASNVTATLSVLDELRSIYRVERSDGVDSLVILATGGNYLAELDSNGTLSALQKGASQLADEGYWPRDLTDSSWSGIAASPTPALGLAASSSITAQIDGGSAFQYSSGNPPATIASTHLVPLALHPVLGADGGLFEGDSINAANDVRPMRLVLSPDKMFAATRDGNANLDDGMLGAWSRSSGAPPAHPIVALASIPLDEFGTQVATSGAAPVIHLQGGATIFEVARVSPDFGASAVGTAVVAEAGSLPGLDAWFALLTNGVDDSCTVRALGIPGPSPESQELQNRAPELLGPDLAGSRPVRLSFDVTRFDVSTPFQFVQIHLVGTVTFFGRLP